MMNWKKCFIFLVVFFIQTGCVGLPTPLIEANPTRSVPADVKAKTISAVPSFTPTYSESSSAAATNTHSVKETSPVPTETSQKVILSKTYGVFPLYFDPEEPNPYRILLSSNGQSVSFGNVTDPYAKVSPDGKRIAFLENGLLQVYDLLTGEVTPIPQTGQAVYGDWWVGTWSPDGKYLAYAASHVEVKGENIALQEFPNIFIADLENNLFVQVTDWPYVDTNPVWSPDGTWIAFQSDRLKVNSSVEGNFVGSSDIFFFRASCVTALETCKSAYIKPLTNFGSVGDASEIAWAPNGKSIAFTFSGQGSAYKDIYSVDLNGEVENLTSSPDENEATFDWSPDGTQMVINRDTYQSHDLWLFSIREKRWQSITRSPQQEDGIPKWSPDGRMIAFSNPYNGTLSIYLIEQDRTMKIKSAMGDNSYFLQWISILPDFQLGERFTISPSGINLNLREEPTTESTSLRKLSPEDVILVIDGPRNNEGYQWWKVQFENLEGWVVYYPAWYLPIPNGFPFLD